ncbi:chitinase [Streptomyces sparsogenes]|uniref:chitinase n=1 Tax=Streptomyces sparsogenes TaxID=67365 RepID=UPI0033F2903E
MRALSTPRLGGYTTLAATLCAAIAVWAGGERPPPPPPTPSAHSPAPTRPSAPAPPSAPPRPSAPVHPSAPPRPSAPARPGVPFVPYVSAWAATGYDMTAAAARGVKEFALGFVVAGRGCAPVWDGGIPLADRALMARIAAARRAGGDVRVSFGGAGGRELATICPDVPQLAAAYAAVIDRYGFTKADFDIEGPALADPVSATRRARAIAWLQRARPDLDVSFTLPAMPWGLTDDSSALLANARAQGVAVSGVNIMAMNYGGEHTGDMGRYAVQAAINAHGRIRGVLGLSEAAAWKTLTVTPMIGVNDVSGEVFTLEDAAGLARFAAAKGIGRLSMWSAERDRPCPPRATTPGPAPTCSGVAQRPGAFEAILTG